MIEIDTCLGGQEFDCLGYSKTLIKSDQDAEKIEPYRVYNQMQ